MASAVPCRVVAPPESADGTEGAEDLLALVRWPGVVGWWERTWIDYLLTGDEARRAQGIDDLAAGTWELASWTWRDTTKLDLMVPDAYFSVSVYFDAEEKSNGWYVDFRRPFTQTSIGLDTLDLMLDLVIESDLTYRWKDEDEYDQGRRLASSPTWSTVTCRRRVSRSSTFCGGEPARSRTGGVPGDAIPAGPFPSFLRTP